MVSIKFPFQGHSYFCFSSMIIPIYVDNVSADLYANDTTLYDIQTSLETIEVNLHDGLNQLHTWCKNNGTVLNLVKTKVMRVTSNQKRLRLQNTNLNLQYIDETLKIISNDKILGVYVDNNFTWSDHVKHVCKTISSYNTQELSITSTSCAIL